MLKQVGDFAQQAIGKMVNSDEMMMEKLAQATNIVVDQTPDWIELCLICEVQNEYKIYETGPTFEYAFNSAPLGVFKESSGCFCRCFLKCAREFKGNLTMGQFQVSQMHAPYKCHNPIPCCSCCCSKPEIQITNHNDELIGRIAMPFFCPLSGWGKCDLMELRVFDKDGNLTYMIHQTCCQKSVCCMPFQCLGCEQIEYVIKDTRKQVVGKIVNLYNDCIRETCSRADKFGITFPDNAEPHKKLLILNAAIWIDYLQYLA